MAQLLDAIPLFQQVVDPQGRITLYYRLLWDKLRTLLQVVPNVGTYEPGEKHAAIAGATLYTVTASGLYLICCYHRVTTPDGVSSAVQASISWTDSTTQTKLGTNVTGDSTTSLDQFVVVAQCDANTVITLTTTYSSTTPNKMGYTPHVRVLQLAA